MRLETGMLVRSKAGHDKDCIYVIISVKDEYVYLTDGVLKPLCHLKKKNRKHIQPITKKVGIIPITNDEEIRSHIKRFHIKRFANHDIEKKDVR